MLIRCPDCAFTRQVNEDKIPANSEFATCPKCKQRFRFRTVEPALASSGEQDASGKHPDSEAPSAEAKAGTPAARKKKDPSVSKPGGDIWDAVEDLNDWWDSRDKTDKTDQSDSEPVSPSSELPEDQPDLPDVPDIPDQNRPVKQDKQDKQSGPGKQSGPDERAGQNARRGARAYENSEIPDQEAGSDQPPRQAHPPHSNRPPYLANSGSVPWEYSGGFPHPVALIRTMVLSMSRIPEFFAGLPGKGSLLPAMIYALLMNIPLLAIVAFTTLTLQTADGEMVNVSLSELEGLSVPKVLLTFLFLIILIQFINAWLVHFIVKLVAKRANFGIAFKTVSYSMTPLIFSIIPIFGVMLANIGAMTVFTLGLRHAYRLSWPHTMMVLLPYLLIKALFTYLFLGGMMG